MTGAKRRLAAVQVAILAVCTAFAVLGPRYVTVLSVAENWSSDFRTSFFNPQRDSHPGIVFIAINEDTLATLPYRSPVDRGFLKDLVETLIAKRVRAIGLDILFDQATEPAKDAALRELLRRAPVPVVASWTDRATGLTEKQNAFQKEYLDGVLAGYANTNKDTVDGTIRTTFPGRTDEDGRYRLGFAPMIADALGYPVPRDSIRITFYGHPDSRTPPFPTFPANLVRLLPDAWLAGRVAVVGADLPFMDRHRTPFAAGLGTGRGFLPGALIHAHILAQIMDGRTHRGSSLPLELATVLVLGFLGSLLVFSNAHAAIKAAAGFGALVALWVGAVALYVGFELAQPMVAPALGFAGTLGLGSAYAARLHKQESRYIAEAFSHYVEPALVKRLQANPEALLLGGAKRQVTLLFTDVEGFTSMSDDLEPTRLVAILNDYLDGMSGIVLRHGGMVDKYIGDAVMAIFGAPEEQADHARRAVACALEMAEFAADFAARRQAEGVAFGRTRIGLHAGEAVVGNVGGRLRFDYTAIGDVVNTASRFEGANKYLGTRICASAAVVDAAGEIPGVRFRPIGTLVVKGREAGVVAFEPLGNAHAADADAYGAAFALFKAGDGRARIAFEAYLRDHPEDRLAAFHLARIAGGETTELIKLEGK